MNNQTTNILPTATCPKAEELSSLHDGMGAAAVAEHVASCPRCQAVLTAYAKLDVMVGQAVAPSATLAATIKNRCRKESQKSQKTLVMWPKENAWKLGAAAAAALAIAGLLMMHTGESENQRTANQLAAAVKPDHSSSNAELPGAAPAVAVAETRVNILPAAGQNGTNAPVRTAVEIASASSADNASFRTVGVSAGPGNDTATPTTLAAIGDTVQHVWVVKDVKEAAELFRQCLPRHHSPVTDVSANGQTMYRVVVNDRDIQSFVNRLNDAGLSLVSPALPQPESGQPLQVLGKPVLYTVELVPAEKP